MPDSSAHDSCIQTVQCEHCNQSSSNLSSVLALNSCPHWPHGVLSSLFCLFRICLRTAVFLGTFFFLTLRLFPGCLGCISVTLSGTQCFHFCHCQSLQRTQVTRLVGSKDGGFRKLVSPPIGRHGSRHGKEAGLQRLAGGPIRWFVDVVTGEDIGHNDGLMTNSWTAHCIKVMKCLVFVVISNSIYS